MKRFPLSRSSCRTARRASAFRAGVTLVEVLISLLVISVALSSVLLLFPLSLLRSVQARQLTQATILRFNAANQLDLHPGLANGLLPNRPGIVDPLGWHLVGETNAAFLDNFGGPDSRLIRTNGGLGNPDFLLTHLVNLNFRAAARKLVSLPDTWVNIAEGVADANTQNTVTLSDFDFSEILAVDGTYRITLFDKTGRFSHVRSITGNQDPNLGWVLNLPADPILDHFFVVGRVKVELLEQRYTWLLTVRNSVRSADVVVFFRRSFSAEDEQIHTAIFSLINPGPDKKPGLEGVDDDNNGFIDDPAELGMGDDFRDPFNRSVPIRWSTAEQQPALKRGGYIFDVQNALWYQIHNILGLDETSQTATLVLDEVIKTHGAGGAILMRGIVDVYPISF